MVEESRPWPGEVLGDCGPYSDDDWDNMWEALYGSGASGAAPYGNRGVIRNWLNELVVTGLGGANHIHVDTGAALVHGKFYRNTAMVDVVDIPSASVGAWREDTIFLRSVWGATQTIRIYRHENSADEATYETPVSIDGVVWHIPLAAVRINNAGTITEITDLREFVSNLVQRKEFQVQPFPGAGGDWVIRGVGPQYFHLLIELDLANDSCQFEFIVPSDFISLRRAILYYHPNGTGSWDYTIGSRFAGCGEDEGTHTDNITANAVPVTIDIFECLDIAAALDGLVAGDVVGLTVVCDALGGATTAIYIAKLLIEYE